MSMKEKNDPNKKHYFQPATIEDFTESMLMQCSSENAQPLTVWEKGENEDDAELYIAVEYLPQTKTIKLKPTGSLITKITGSLKAGKQVLVKIPIQDRINYFTGGKLKFHPDELTYSIEILQDIFKSQQRGNFRLNSSTIIPIQFKIDEQVFPAEDISIGGTSFIIEAIDKDRFAKGALFKECTLRFDRKNYYIPFAQVAAIIPVLDEAGAPNGKIKIGISFKELARKTEDELYIKISSEARGEEMRKKFDTILAKKSDPT
ncbi:MAG: PilZ domain-containing protein [Bacteriovorax sp.]|nr:PilZ domain-containing protein [Bacteriovorax sp.]